MGGDLYNRSLYNVKMIPKCEDLCALRVALCVCVWGGGDLYNRSLYNVKMIPKCEDLCALRVALCVCVWGGGNDYAYNCARKWLDFYFKKIQGQKSSPNRIISVILTKIFLPKN